MSSVQVGDVLDGRYRIDTPIARGGMSIVYRSVDLRLGRQVAAKVMDDRFASDPVFRTRFEREARSMAQLNHPNLVNVYDFSSNDEHAFLIMELITGGTLRELLADRGPMPPHAATAVLRGLLTGLSIAHEKGMVHRDIKPDNVLINSDHRVKLADFGLVRAVAKSERTTDQIVGTVTYLSPEQVDGGPITPASDVYSAGILLFELLTGTVPFAGETQLAHALARLDKDVPPPSTRIAGVPPLFDELVAAAAQRNPEDRFASAAEFLAALDDVAAELQLPSFAVPVPRNSAAARATSIITTPREDTQTTKVVEARPAENTVAPETAVIPAAPLQPFAPSFDDQQTKAVSTPVPARANETALTPLDPPPSASAPAVRSLPESNQKPVSNRSTFKVLVWLIIVGMLIASVAVGGWWFGSGRYGEIPQVLGMEQSAAEKSIQQSGFQSTLRQVYSDDVPRGQIVGTDPPFSQRAPRGSQVAVLVSMGQPTVPALPNGGDVQRFRQILEERTLKLSFGEDVFSDTTPVGGIVKTSPSPGQQVRTGSTVTVSISKGPAPVAVPDVSGLQLDDARSALEAAGLKAAAVENAYSSTVAGGHVISSNPPANSKLARGSEVSLKVSNALKVPDIEGKSVETAQQMLIDAGFVVAITRVDESASRPDTVIKSDPTPGSSVDPVSPKVELAVNKKVEVQSVLGKSVEEATKILKSQGFKVETNRDSGVVLLQSPRGRSAVEPGTSISLTAL